MDATPYLVQMAKALKAAKLEAILIGNAGAALQGAPVTTLDLDFYYRDTALNRRKLQLVADSMHAQLTQPFPGLSTMFRLDFGDVYFHVDFLAVADGISSLASLRSRAIPVAIGGSQLLVASLLDIVKSKRESGRPKDLAVIDALEKTIAEIEAQDQA